MDVKESLVRMDKKETCLFELVEKKRVTWEITHQCNYRCLHCCTKAGERYENELITSRVLSLIDEMSNCDVEGIYFSGGEPLMRKDICDIIAKAASKNMKRLSLATNGSLISEDFAGRLSKSGLHSALISLDGHTADVHNSLRGIKKAYADALNGTSLLSKKGIKVRAGTVIWEKNKDFLDEIILVALKNGATSVFFNWLLKVGNGLGNHSIYVDWKEYFKIAKKLGDLKEKYKGKIEVGYHRFKIIES
ncbi:TPA: radical SAM protein, partial [Candidatus Woesearchaeota archaeon]|nr:radical SAM protein [Candidatus Woesearchaeota archaeon]